MWVEGGEFLMGSSDSDPYARDNEKPQHRVKLSGFWMSATEVTNAQYDQFLWVMEAKGGAEWDAVKKSSSHYPDLDDRFKGANQPVVCVSYDDAQAFCKWVGHGVTLPTEAQWEYACRAGSTTRFSFGDTLTFEQANILWSPWQEDGRTRAVGQYEKNAFGLYDMYGNVCEWCSDWYSEDYYQGCKGAGNEDKLEENPKGPATGDMRINRGGGWNKGAWTSRSAHREAGEPQSCCYDFLGFRIVAPAAP
ncbi:MAG: hypothetical protein CSA97_02825 [Bacteroidetes bacterium]|nr:MAG: hypothetical protein CSA97_02825 [Bacteroidota bacterium]